MAAELLFPLAGADDELDARVGSKDWVPDCILLFRVVVGSLEAQDQFWRSWLAHPVSAALSTSSLDLGPSIE